jgi:reactive intermediate/imine deaminase
MKTIISTPNAPAAIGTYSQAVRVGTNAYDTVYLSGQIPLNPATMILVEGFDDQVKQVFDNLKAVCEAAGGSLNDLVKVNIYLTDLGNFAKVNEIMATYFVQPYPARAAVGVSALPRGSQIEIDGVLVVSASAR